MELGFWTNGLIRLLGPSGPNVVSRPQTPRSNIFFEISWFYWIHIMIIMKMRSCLRKLEPRFWTYDLIWFLGPIGPNVVSRPQTPRSKSFLKFHNFIGFISWFLRKGGPVCENWSQGCRLIARYVFQTPVALM